MRFKGAKSRCLLPPILKYLKYNHLFKMKKEKSNNKDKEQPNQNILYPVKKYIWLFGGVAILALLLYAIRFIDRGWSTDPGDWGVFGDYIGGVFNPIIALITLLVTIRIAIRLNE